MPSYLGSSPDSGDFSVTYAVVDWSDKPILLIDIKPPGYYSMVSMRCLVDREMRDHLVKLVDVVTKPYIYGISVFGEQFAVYRLTVATGEVEPRSIHRAQSNTHGRRRAETVVGQ